MSKKSDDEGATPPSSGGIRSSEDLDEQQIDSASAPNNSTTEAAAAAAGKPEEIKDDSAACPVPLNSAIFEDDEGAKKRAAALHSDVGREDIIAHPTILEDDDAHPMPLHSVEYDEGVKKRAATAPLYAAEEGEVDGPSLIEVEDDGYHPVPFNSANFEDDEEVKRRAAAGMAPLSSRVSNNVMTATVNETYDEEEALGIDNEGDALEIDNGQEDADSLQQSNQQSSSDYDDSAMVDLDSSVAVIPHAYLVEDDDDDNMVIAGYAEPIPPWWKQRRMRGMLAVIFLVLIAAAVAIGVSESKRRSTVGAAIFLTSSPTQSNAPSTPPTVSPTISFAPSLSPTSCSDTIVLNTKEVNIDIFVGGLKEPKVAIDGDNMVVVARDSTGYIYVIFYKKSIDGEWARARYFVEECQRSANPSWTGLNDYNCLHSVSFSGSTALVGLQSERHTSEVATPVVVFEQTELGQWVKVESLSPPPPSKSQWINFGYSVGIDGDLACVLGHRSDGIIYGPTLVIYHKVSGGWEQLYQDSVSTSHSNGFTGCEVSGSTIMAFTTRKKMLYYYLFDRATGSIERIQNDSGLSDVFEATSLDGDLRSFDGNYLVLSDYKEVWNVDWQLVRRDYTVYIYRRDKENEPFLLRQRLMDYDYEEGFGRTLDVHDDTLVVGGNNRTFVFMDHGDFFEESITLEKTYTGIEIFNRQVIATTEDNRVETFVISEDCTQLVPTQTPSLSSAPSVTQSPSTIPSQSPTGIRWSVGTGTWRIDTMPPTASPSERADPGKPSSSPSLSSSPTEKCFMINISFQYDAYPSETIWTLTQVGVNGEDGNVIKSYRPQLKEDQSRVESMCLKEGRYKFIVQDWDGICCANGFGHYNVTSYGQMIAQGGKFEREEARIFDLPYDSNSSPSQSPSLSASPSSSPTTSSRPSVKPSLVPSYTASPSSFPTTSLAPTITPRPTFCVTTPFPTFVPTTSTVPTITPWPTFVFTPFPTFVPTFESQITTFPTESPKPGNPNDESTSEPTAPIPVSPPDDRVYCENACVDEVECQEMCAEIALEWGWTADEQSDCYMPFAGCFVADFKCYFGNFVEGGDYDFDEYFDDFLLGRTRRLCCDNI